MAIGPIVRAAASRQVLTDHVYDELMVAFIDGRLEADSPLNIDSLAREFDISQTPIREALARLESTGLVIRTALKGYRVAPLFSGEEIAELMDARRVIEPHNAFLACSRADDALVRLLATTIDDLAHSLADGDVAPIASYWQADERFHRLIAEHSGNRFLLSAYNALGGHVQRFRLFGGLGVSDARPAIAEHTVILDAFRSNDPESARHSMDTHICGVRARAISDTTSA